MKKERTWFRSRTGRKRKGQKEPKTVAPEAPPVLEAANLQGLGNRAEQQDAFGVSPLERYESDGLLAVLCDGMGGMAEGGRIAAETVEELLGAFPEMKETDMEPWLRRRSGRVYRQFRGCGGTTLVGVMLKGRMLSFWCAGDSDLLLLREGVLYSLNTRQEFRNELVLRALAGAFPLEEAFRGAGEVKTRLIAQGLVYYPSDHRKFKFHVAFAACRRLPGVGYYISRLRTRRDTVLSAENIEALAEAVERFLPRYLEGGEKKP